jgi:hypothetical protein
MRIESSVTAISWIPSEAIEGMPKIPFEMGIGHYDEPPPDKIGQGELERLRDEDRFREANDLRAWIEVEDGKIVGHGHGARATSARPPSSSARRISSSRVSPSRPCSPTPK